MKASHILCGILAAASLTFGIRATALSDGGVATEVAAQSSARPSAPKRHTNTKAGRDAAVGVPPRHGAAISRHPVGQATRGNADRMHLLPNAQASERRAGQPSRSVGSAGAATGHAPDVRGTHAVNPPVKPKLALSNAPIRSQGNGRLGGPAIGRPAPRAFIDGTPLRRKF